jgi:predicted RNase H-like nuclease (RuvC/YqgF family)
MQREKYEEAMRHLREDKEKEIKDLKAQSKARADENHELRGLCEKKDAEMIAFQAQIKDELELQRLKTQQAEEKYESLEKQLSGGEAGMKDLEDRLQKVSEFPFILIMFKQLMHLCRRKWSCQQQRKPRT